MQKRLLSALVLGMALTTTATAHAQPNPRLPDAAQRDITVVSYNIHHAAGEDGVLSLERIAQLLESMDADVIGLQEVDSHWSERSDFEDQASWLARRLKMDVCYSANLDLTPAEGQTELRQYGTAILSEHKLSNCSNTPLPNHPGGEQRGLAQADVKVRGVDLRFYNTHLTHNSQTGPIAPAEAINEIVADDAKPSVLVGDLDATPISPEYALFTTHLNDVWPAVGEGPGYTIGAANPSRRIDYILVSDDIQPQSAYVPSSLASDHLPVVATIRLPHPGKVNSQ